MIPIIDLDLSIRSYQALKAIGISFLSQLREYSKCDLLNHRISSKSIEEIDEYMVKYNIPWLNQIN
jgi:DNA-directed RNA polymerase alpha subunit